MLCGVWGPSGSRTPGRPVEREEQGKRLAELARRAGVRHYVYTSVGSTIDCAGEAPTPAQVARRIAKTAGRPVRHVRVPIEDVRKFSGGYPAMLEWFEAVGYDVDIDGNAGGFGIAPTRFRDWVTTVRCI